MKSGKDYPILLRNYPNYQKNDAAVRVGRKEWDMPDPWFEACASRSVHSQCYYTAFHQSETCLDHVEVATWACHRVFYQCEDEIDIFNFCDIFTELGRTQPQIPTHMLSNFIIFLEWRSRYTGHSYPVVTLPYCHVLSRFKQMYWNNTGSGQISMRRHSTRGRTCPNSSWAFRTATFQNWIIPK